MNIVTTALLENVRIIAALVEHPTHRLRTIDNTDAILPRLAHEDRLIQSVMRTMTGDSRHAVVSAIHRTLSILVGVVKFAPRDVTRQLLELEATFNEGLKRVRTMYEHDVSIGVRSSQFAVIWADLMMSIKPILPPLTVLPGEARSLPIDIPKRRVQSL
jgi:hypothetical protein